MLVNVDNPEEITEMNDIKLKLKKKNLFFTERKVSKYTVKKSKDNMRYGLTEKEISIIEEYENMLGTTVIKDVDHLVKKTIVDLLDEKYNMCNDTKEFMYDLAKTDLSEAYANRLMKINILEMNGLTTRLDYLTHVE